LYTSSAQEAAVAAAAEGKAAQLVTAQALSEPLAGPVAFDALAAVDHGADLRQGGACGLAIEGDEPIAQPQGLCSPRRGYDVWLRAQKAFQPCQAVCDGRDGVAPVKVGAKDHGADRDGRSSDDDVHVGGAAADDDMLPAERVDENVRDVGQGRDTDTRRLACHLLERTRREAERVRARLGQPDGMSFGCRQCRISESSTGPTPPRTRGGRAGA
jgi:hypothetical protein